MVRYGIVGCGSISRFHFNALKKIGAKITCVADINLEAAQKRADEFGARAVTDYRELVTADDVDVVSITCIGVKHSGVDNPDALAFDGGEPLRLPQAVLPHILHQFFHGQRIKLPIKLVNIEKTSNKTAEKSGYMSIMLCFAHSSICSSGQIEACTSPMWAFWSKNIHRRL